MGVNTGGSGGGGVARAGWSVGTTDPVTGSAVSHNVGYVNNTIYNKKIMRLSRILETEEVGTLGGEGC
jgi:hypothetical protein